MGGHTTLYIYKKSHIDLGPLAKKFGTFGMPPIEAPLWTPSCKIKQMCTLGFHLFSLYTKELNFRQTIWDKTQVLLGIC
jgi:hypothetical protein